MIIILIIIILFIIDELQWDKNVKNMHKDEM